MTRIRYRSSGSKLINNIRLYRAINKHYGSKPGFFGPIHDGFRAWLDDFERFAKVEPCGCARLLGGGIRFCEDKTHFYREFSLENDFEYPSE